MTTIVERVYCFLVNNRLEYSITSKSRNKYLVKPLIKGLILDLIIGSLFAYFYSLNLISTFKLFIAILIGQGILFYIPLILLYINYYKSNKRTILKVEEDHFTFITKSTSHVVYIDEIDKVDLHVSIPKKSNRTIWFFWHKYFYIRVFTPSRDFIITCLICEEFSDFYPELNVSRIGHHMPLIK